MQKGIIKNVNKLTGEPIDAKDLASMLSGIIGNESGVLTVFDELRLEKISDNKVRLHSGVYSLKGHILYIPKGSYEDFEIESGTLGANRIDLLVAEYVKNGEGEGEDILRFRILKGDATSGQPQAPDIIQQDINANGIRHQSIIYKIRLSGVFLSLEKSFDRIGSLSRQMQELANWMDIDFRPIDSWNGVIKFPSGLMIQYGRRPGQLNNDGRASFSLHENFVGDSYGLSVTDTLNETGSRTFYVHHKSPGFFSVTVHGSDGNPWKYKHFSAGYVAFGRWK